MTSTSGWSPKGDMWRPLMWLFIRGGIVAARESAALKARGGLEGGDGRGIATWRVLVGHRGPHGGQAAVG